jgi:hypothetical protein
MPHRYGDNFEKYKVDELKVSQPEVPIAVLDPADEIDMRVRNRLICGCVRLRPEWI